MKTLRASFLFSTSQFGVSVKSESIFFLGLELRLVSILTLTLNLTHEQDSF